MEGSIFDQFNATEMLRRSLANQKYKLTNQRIGFVYSDRPDRDENIYQIDKQLQIVNIRLNEYQHVLNRLRVEIDAHNANIHRKNKLVAAQKIRYSEIDRDFPNAIVKCRDTEHRRIMNRMTSLGIKGTSSWALYSLEDVYKIYKRETNSILLHQYNIYNGTTSPRLDTAYNIFRERKAKSVSEQNKGNPATTANYDTTSYDITIIHLQHRSEPVLRKSSSYAPFNYHIVFSDGNGSDAYRIIFNFLTKHLMTKPTYPFLVYTSSLSYGLHQYIFGQVITAITNSVAGTKYAKIKNEIVFINDTDTYVVKRSPTFRKVVNSQQYQRYERPVLSEKVGMSFTNKDLRGKVLTTNRQVELYDRLGNLYNVYIYSIPPLSSELSRYVDDKWWCKYFMKSPKCSRSRLYQMSGTCWFNTNLNEMILGNLLKEFLIGRYRILYSTPESKQELYELYLSLFNTASCPMKSNATLMRNYLFSIIQQLAIGSETIHSDINIVGNLMSRTFSDLNHDDGYDASKGITEILGMMLQAKDYDICRCNDLNEVLNIEDDLQSTSSVVAVIARRVYFGDYDKHAIPSNFVTKTGRKFVLDSVGISNGMHSIVGFLCGTTPYVYDSNNIIAKSDWLHHDFAGYYDAHWDYFHQPILNMCFVRFIIYVAVL